MSQTNNPASVSKTALLTIGSRINHDRGATSTTWALARRSSTAPGWSRLNMATEAAREFSPPNAPPSEILSIRIGSLRIRSIRASVQASTSRSIIDVGSSTGSVSWPVGLHRGRATRRAGRVDGEHHGALGGMEHHRHRGGPHHDALK